MRFATGCMSMFMSTNHGAWTTQLHIKICNSSVFGISFKVPDRCEPKLVSMVPMFNVTLLPKKGVPRRGLFS